MWKKKPEEIPFDFLCGANRTTAGELIIEFMIYQKKREPYF
jgi:hypothetical protein